MSFSRSFDIEIAVEILRSRMKQLGYRWMEHLFSIYRKISVMKSGLVKLESEKTYYVFALRYSLMTLTFTQIYVQSPKKPTSLFEAAVDSFFLKKRISFIWAWLLRPATLLRKILWCKCFLENFAKFLRTPFLQNTSCESFRLKVFKLNKSEKSSNLWYLEKISKYSGSENQLNSDKAIELIRSSDIQKLCQ